jgi:hypothetical protein
MKSEGFASVTARWHLQPTPPRWPGFPPRAVTLPALHPPPPAPGPTVKRAARQARQAGCPRPPYKHHAREALPMHALVFRAHSHIQPCTMRHPTPFSQLRRFQQPFFQRARSLPPLQMPAPSLASKKQRHARNTRVFAVARAPLYPAEGPNVSSLCQQQASRVQRPRLRFKFCSQARASCLLCLPLSLL